MIQLQSFVLELPTVLSALGLMIGLVGVLVGIVSLVGAHRRRRARLKIEYDSLDEPQQTLLDIFRARLLDLGTPNSVTSDSPLEVRMGEIEAGLSGLGETLEREINVVRDEISVVKDDLTSLMVAIEVSDQIAPDDVRETLETVVDKLSNLQHTFASSGSRGRSTSEYARISKRRISYKAGRDN